LDDKTRQWLATALGIALTILLLWALYAYVFIWHNTPNLEQLTGLHV